MRTLRRCFDLFLSMRKIFDPVFFIAGLPLFAAMIFSGVFMRNSVVFYGFSILLGIHLCLLIASGVTSSCWNYYEDRFKKVFGLSCNQADKKVVLMVIQNKIQSGIQRFEFYQIRNIASRFFNFSINEGKWSWWISTGIKTTFCFLFLVIFALPSYAQKTDEGRFSIQVGRNWYMDHHKSIEISDSVRIVGPNYRPWDEPYPSSDTVMITGGIPKKIQCGDSSLITNKELMIINRSIFRRKDGGLIISLSDFSAKKSTVDNILEHLDLKKSSDPKILITFPNRMAVGAKASQVFKDGFLQLPIDIDTVDVYIENDTGDRSLVIISGQKQIYSEPGPFGSCGTIIFPCGMTSIYMGEKEWFREEIINRRLRLRQGSIVIYLRWAWIQ